MEFFSTAFLVFAPILIMVSLFTKKPLQHYLLNALAVVNILLIANSLHTFSEFYHYFKLAKEVDIEPSNANVEVKLGWQQGRDLIVLFLPFLFLIKPISYNRTLSLILILLLKYNMIVYIVDCIKGKSNFYFEYYFEYNYWLKMMNYLSWFSLLFGLFYFINYLPKKRQLLSF